MAANQSWLQRAIGFGVLFIVIGVSMWMATTPAPRVKPKPAEALAIDKSAAAQRERKALIDELVAKGLLRRVDPERGGEVRVTLRPAFYLLDDETRRKYVDAIYAYFFDGSSVNDTVILRDGRNGNEIGHYNPYRGGLKIYK